MKISTKVLFGTLLIGVLALSDINPAAAQNGITGNDKSNVEYKTKQRQQELAGIGMEQKIKSPMKFMKDANFTLYTFPMKGTAYLSVNSAIPNEDVKVLVYDVAGKIIFNRQMTTGGHGEFVVQIDPNVDYVPGECFVAALYNNQAFYETIALNK